jgi:hypothetical protein
MLRSITDCYGANRQSCYHQFIFPPPRASTINVGKHSQERYHEDAPRLTNRFSPLRQGMD